MMLHRRAKMERVMGGRASEAPLLRQDVSSESHRNFGEALFAQVEHTGNPGVIQEFRDMSVQRAGAWQV